MSATYDSSLSTDTDWVRFLIGDYDQNAETVTSPFFSNEEIAAVITEEGGSGDHVKYYAAATCLAALYTRWAGKGKGIMEKQVSRLRIKYGADSSAAAALQARIRELREKGAYVQMTSPEVFGVL